jgi:hypothetical protein
VNNLPYHQWTIVQQVKRHSATKAYWNARRAIRAEPHLADSIIAIYSRFWRKEVTFINYLREIADEQQQNEVE